MKKVMAIAIGVLLCIALALPLFAESQGVVAPEGMKVLFEDDFSGELDSAKWSVREAVAVSDGTMVLGNGGSWVAGGYSATAVGSFNKYAVDFDFTGDKRDCYYGIGVRAPAGGASEFQNGGRFNVPSASEISRGISFDLFISPNENAENGGKNVGVALNNGGENGSSAQFLVAYPEGFDGSSGHVTVVDAGDTITLYINNSELVTLKLGEGSVTAYNAAGEKIFEGEAAFPASGSFAFYQRNDLLKIDNVVVSSIEKRDFSSEKGDHLSYDQIIVNGTEIANGNDAVIAAKALIDGSDGSIETVAMHGWYGNDNSKIESYGYMIDGNEPVFGEFTVEAEPAVISSGGESRFTVVVDVSAITDGKTHRIDAVVKLENGQVVTLNRNESGKDREVFVNYKSVAEPKANMDKFMVNGTGDNHNSRDSGDEITINEGDTIKTLGWVFKYGTNVKRVYWQYVEKGGKIKDGTIVDCADTYRSRNDVAAYFGYTAEDYQYFVKAGFGSDDDLMTLTGIDSLAAGEYDVRFVAEFEDGTTEVIKKKFALIVESTAAPKTELIGKNFDEVYANVTTIKVRGWARLNAAIGQFGYRIDDGEVVYNDAFQVDRSDVWDFFGVTKEVANGFDLTLPASTVPAGVHTFTLLLKAADGTVFELGAMPVETPHEEAYTNIIDFDDADAYGMSFDAFWWNNGALGGAGRATADLFVRPDAMPVDDYGGISTGYNGWVAFKQKVKGFGYIIDGKLFVSGAFTQANEDTLGPTVDAWPGWAGAGETVQRYNVQVPFAGQSGKINVMAAAILEDGTVVRLNSKATHDRDTEINFIFNDARDLYGSMGALDTGWWNNPFNKDSVATITFTANEAFDGFETFIYASDEAQSIHMTLKDSDGNAVWEEDFNMSGNQRYTFYKRLGKFAQGDYTIEFDGRNMADDAGTWIVFGSTVPVEGEEKVAAASGNYGSNAGYTTLSFGLITGTEYKEGSSRDQVTVDNVDKASFGGNPEVTDITENLHDLIGKQIRFWGWYGNNTELVKFGVKVDGGEMIYFDRYEDAGIVAHLQGVFKENAVSASRFEILVDITEGEHTAEVYAITDRGEVLVWTVNYNAVEEAVTQPTTEPETNQQTGDVALMVFASVVVLALGAAVVFKKKRVF